MWTLGFYASALVGGVGVVLLVAPGLWLGWTLVVVGFSGVLICMEGDI